VFFLYAVVCVVAFSTVDLMLRQRFDRLKMIINYLRT